MFLFHLFTTPKLIFIFIFSLHFFLVVSPPPSAAQTLPHSSRKRLNSAFGAKEWGEGRRWGEGVPEAGRQGGGVVGGRQGGGVVEGKQEGRGGGRSGTGTGGGGARGEREGLPNLRTRSEILPRRSTNIFFFF